MYFDIKMNSNLPCSVLYGLTPSVQCEKNYYGLMGVIQLYFCIFIDSVFSAVLGLLLKPGIRHIDLCYNMPINSEIKDHFSPSQLFYESKHRIL